MNSNVVNKVILKLGSKPMILHAIELLESLKISPIIVVVGFAKKSVIDILKKRVVYAHQKKRLGTADAVKSALKYLPENINDVLVLNGDDSAFYKKETIEELINTHWKRKPSVTFLTIEADNPSGLGRVVRNDNGELFGIVEDKDAILEYKSIKEINPGCYIFDLTFLKRYIGKIEKSSVSGEYYLTRLIDIAIKNNKKAEAPASSPLTIPLIPAAVNCSSGRSRNKYSK